MTCHDCKFYRRRCMDRFRDYPCRSFHPLDASESAQIDAHGVLPDQTQTNSPEPHRGCVVNSGGDTDDR